MEINFISSKDSKDSTNFNETRTMHTASDNIEITISDETDEIIKNFFESLLQSYQEGLKK